MKKLFYLFCLLLVVSLFSCQSIDQSTDEKEYNLIEKSFLRFIDYNLENKETVDFQIEFFDTQGKKIGEAWISY